MLIDTHCHLDAAEFDRDRSCVFEAAQRAGVTQLVIPSVTVASFDGVRACCADFPGCRPAYGIHPLYLEGATENDLGMLREALIRERSGLFPPVAVGEIGLDFFHSGNTRERQERFFVEQLKIARDFDLPVVLHVRRAVDEVLNCLRRVSVKGGVAHAFNGSRQQAEAYIRHGFKLGFGGALTFSGSTRIRALVRGLPLDAIVLETDAPDIPPAWLGGRRNTPDQLLPIAQALADLRQEPLEEIVRVTSEAAQSVFGFYAN